MTTLAIMKARIKAETARDDLSEAMAVGLDDAITAEIKSAINFYRSKRFWFNEKATTTEGEFSDRDCRFDFQTVIGQSRYGSIDQKDIPNLIRIDALIVNDVEQGGSFRAALADPGDMEIWLASNSALSSVPVNYSYYAQKINLYPIPDRVISIKIMGVMRVNVPSSDTETNNPWMTDGEELIRARAKRNLYLNWMLGTEPGLISTMKSLEDEALESLRQETSSRTQVSRIRGVRF